MTGQLLRWRPAITSIRGYKQKEKDPAIAGSLEREIIMKKKIQKFVSLFMAAVLAVSALTACSSSGETKTTTSQTQAADSAAETQAEAEESKKGTGKTVNVAAATPPSTSAAYAYVIGLTNALMEYNPDYNVTTTETGGAVEQAKMLYTRDTDIAIIMSSTADEQVKGTGNFDGHPDDGLRGILWFAPNIMYWMVNSSLGLTKVDEITPTFKFGPSGEGTSNEQDTYRIFECLGIDADYYVASQGDALNAYQDGTAMGVSKGGYYPESYVQQVIASKDTTILSLTDEETDKIITEFPFYTKYTIPAGTYTGQDYDVNSVASLMGIGATTETDPQLVYDIVMAMVEEDEIWKNAYPTGADIDWQTLSTQTVTSVKLHAGAVKAYKDLGYEVPEELIPEEYASIYGN